MKEPDWLFVGVVVVLAVGTSFFALNIRFSNRERLCPNKAACMAVSKVLGSSAVIAAILGFLASTIDRIWATLLILFLSTPGTRIRDGAGNGQTSGEAGNGQTPVQSKPAVNLNPIERGPEDPLQWMARHLREWPLGKALDKLSDVLDEAEGPVRSAAIQVLDGASEDLIGEFTEQLKKKQEERGSRLPDNRVVRSNRIDYAKEDCEKRKKLGQGSATEKLVRLTFDWGLHGIRNDFVERAAASSAPTGLPTGRGSTT